MIIIHLADNEAALLHDDLGGSLGVDAEAAGVERDDGAHVLPRAVEGVHLLEPRVRHLFSQLKPTTLLYYENSEEEV